MSIPSLAEHIPCLDTARRLKAAGYKSDTVHYYCKDGKDNAFYVNCKEDTSRKEVYPAPLASELLNMLPLYIVVNINKKMKRFYQLVIDRSWDGFEVFYIDPVEENRKGDDGILSGPLGIAEINCYDVNLAEALSQLYIALRKQKMIDAKGSVLLS